MTHEIDLTGINLPARIALQDLLGGYLDAGNYEDACLAIIAHPASVDFSQETLRRLWAIGTHRRVHSRVDRKMIDALADYVEAAEGIAWNH